MFGLGTKALWWILGTLATGVVVAAATSEPERKVLTFRFPHDPGEKFMDPLYVVWGNSPYRVLALDSLSASPRPAGLGSYIHRYTMTNEQNEVYLWLEYLAGVPTNGAARIAAIRATMAARRAKQGVSPTSSGMILPSLVLQSRDTLFKIGNDVARTYTNIAAKASVAASVADQLGVSTSKVQDEAKSMLAAASSLTDYKLIEAAVTKYGPIAKATVKGIMTAVSIGTSESSEKEKAVAVISGLADAALAIPGYGLIISGALRLVGGVLQGSVDAAAEFCREDVAIIRDSVNKALSLGMPVPWHAYEVFSLACPDDDLKAEGYTATPDQTSLIGIFADNLKQWQELPAGVRIAALRWWGIAQTYMSDPRVSEVFALSGYDAAGGTIASDEQVLLVAAPIAVAYGIPVDEFAIALWNASPGWASQPDALHYRSYSYCATAGDKMGKPTGCTIPKNAWWVQWGVLADHAFKLAEKWARKPPKLIKLAMVSPT